MDDQKQNGLGIAGFCIALVAIPCAWIPVFGWVITTLGLILSAIAIRNKPRGLAISGLVLSLVSIAISISIIAATATLFGGVTKGLLDLNKSIIEAENNIQATQESNIQKTSKAKPEVNLDIIASDSQFNRLLNAHENLYGKASFTFTNNDFTYKTYSEYNDIVEIIYYKNETVKKTFYYATDNHLVTAYLLTDDLFELLTSHGFEVEKSFCTKLLSNAVENAVNEIEKPKEDVNINKKLSSLSQSNLLFEVESLGIHNGAWIWLFVLTKKTILEDQKLAEQLLEFAKEALDPKHQVKPVEF